MFFFFFLDNNSSISTMYRSRSGLADCPLFRLPDGRQSYMQRRSTSYLSPGARLLGTLDPA